MAKPKPITKAQVMDAARKIVEDAAQFWGLPDGVLTLDLVLKSGVNPLEFESPVPFKAAIEKLAVGLAERQQRLDTPEEADPVSEPTVEEDEEAAMADYERRVAEATDPDVLAQILREDEELLTSEKTAEREATQRRAEDSYARWQKERKRQPSISKGITEQDEVHVYHGDEFVPKDETPSKPQPLPTDIDELHDLWVKEGRPVRGPDGKVVRSDD